MLCLNCKGGHVDLLQLMEQLGQERDRQHFAGGRRHPELGRIEKRDRSTGAGIYRAQGVRRENGENACGGYGRSNARRLISFEEQPAFKLGEDFLIESEVDYPCSPGSLKKSER